MAKQRTCSEWLSLITECRQSGLSDYEWCSRNGISQSTFYKAVRRLRGSAEIAAPSSKQVPYDLTNDKRQDVVPIRIIPETDVTEAPEMPMDHNPGCQMMISCGNIRIQLTNDISPAIIKHVIRALGDLT